MYRHIFITMVFLLSLSLPFNGFALEEKTLGEIKKELLGKEVIISGFKTSRYVKFHKEDFFLEWRLAEGDTQTGFKEKEGDLDSRLVPYRLKGARGVVKAIEITKNYSREKKIGSTSDLFGDTIKDDDILNPYFKVVVKLQDGTFLIKNGYYVTIMLNDLELASSIDAIKEEASKNMTSLIGKTILPVAYSDIFAPDVDIADLTDTLRGNLKKLRDIPNLTPLKIVKAKYLENENGVLLKVEYLGGKMGIIFSRFLNEMFFENLSFFEHVTFNFLAEIPAFLTGKEIDAIKRKTIFIGMSIRALHYSWGFPKKENDWGKGGRQLIYANDQIVYVENDKVVDWQSLTR